MRSSVQGTEISAVSVLTSAKRVSVDPSVHAASAEEKSGYCTVPPPEVTLATFCTEGGAGSSPPVSPELPPVSPLPGPVVSPCSSAEANCAEGANSRKSAAMSAAKNRMKIMSLFRSVLMRIPPFFTAFRAFSAGESTTYSILFSV